MRLSDAGLRQRQTKLIYPNHRFPPWPNEAAARDRSNRLLEAMRRSHNRTNQHNTVVLNKLHGRIAAQARHFGWRWRHLDHVRFGILRIDAHGVFVVPSR